MSKVFSGPYFPAFELNTEIYSVQIQENTGQKKRHIWTLYTKWIRILSSNDKDNLVDK